MKYIAHAGGSVDGKKYTNSLEALQLSLLRGFKYVELDVVKLLDGYGLAHDGMEAHYGCVHFSQVKLTSFVSLKVYEKYAPLCLTDLLRYSDRVCFIFDTKFGSPEELKHFAVCVKELNLSTRPIFQIYSCIDAKMICEVWGFDVVLIFALWKNYASDSLCFDAINELESIKALMVTKVYVSLSYVKYTAPNESYLEDVRFEGFNVRCDVIFHNVPERMASTLEGRFGLYID